VFHDPHMQSSCLVAHAACEVRHLTTHSAPCERARQSSQLHAAGAPTAQLERVADMDELFESETEKGRRGSVEISSGTLLLHVDGRLSKSNLRTRLE